MFWIVLIIVYFVWKEFSKKDEEISRLNYRVSNLEDEHDGYY